MEKAYKLESKEYLFHSVEILLLSAITIILIYLNLIIPEKVIPIVMLIAYLYSIYYTLKAIIVYSKMKKQYYMNTMKEIIKNKKEEK